METMTQFTFPVGYKDFHKSRVFNFQFNRWHTFGYARADDMRKAAAQTREFSDWAGVMEGIAKEAEQDGRSINAAFYYRAGEFYLPPGNAKKAEMYESFKRLIHPVMQKDGVEFIDVPYQDGYLPCLHKKHEHKKGTIVIHGGFDSFKEEFYSYVSYFHTVGYEVVVFEGPGQGDARRKHNLGFDYHWELPTGAVLDYFKLQDVTLLGVSMGGYLCLRAAAFEKRIKRVIASSVVYDYTAFNPPLLRPVIKLFYNQLAGFTNSQAQKSIQKGGFKAWYFSNLMYMMKLQQPLDAIRYLTRMNAQQLHNDRITQDVLLMTGKDDHLVPFRVHQKQVDALQNAKSVTGKVFTQESHASNHCQIGNIGLSLRVMADWIQAH